ncbi:hypothetical protein [Clostridium botulinum]|uniref:hypothetical protein n=1 Tax=Clostridium botulinum TaxID=1491 RepID=UPI0004D00F6D|nr:hypothetical protein [Clostridium botulinum]HDI3019215.1 hypothetical protein [Clostridium botulinum]
MKIRILETETTKKALEIINQLPYYIAIGRNNNWNDNIVMDKPVLISLLNKYNWYWEIEESYIDDNIYTLIVKFSDVNYTPPSDLIIKEKNDVYYTTYIGIYITKDYYDELLK